MKLAEPIDAQARTAFQKAVIQLRDRVMLYQQLKHSVQLPDSADFLAELLQFQKDIPAGVAAFRARQEEREVRRAGSSTRLHRRRPALRQHEPARLPPHHPARLPTNKT